MKSSEAEILPIIGTSMDGGFYAGHIYIDHALYALIAAPKAEGQHDATRWNKSIKSIDGARSYFDGHANTLAMAAAGSKLATWALDLRIGGHDDWYLPSQDELEILYHTLKPTTDQNYCWGRSGINVSSAPPTYPYTPEIPARTLSAAFMAGSQEAFDCAWYWSSTQYAADSDYAWMQDFSYGSQDTNHKSDEFRARAVRRLLIIQ